MRLESPGSREWAGALEDDEGDHFLASREYERRLRGPILPRWHADATAFAPRALSRSPELVQVSVHQPHQLKEVQKAANRALSGSIQSQPSMFMGELPAGATVAVSLDCVGAQCDGAAQRRIWQGEPLSFTFALHAEPGVKRVAFVARVFVNDAEIGTIGFIRRVTGKSRREQTTLQTLRLKRYKRVFLSYSSQDREIVSSIATAYYAAGIKFFWDRTSLASGEEWSPRLRKEIDRCDLFHLCWSRGAAASEWVEREACYALSRNRRNRGSRPNITVQMLDGPPWAPHPPSLASINFDDFVRAAVVGYARGEG